jgi:hypothetical protein
MLISRIILKKLNLASLFIAVFINLNTYAQTSSVGINTPNPNATLEVKPTTSNGATAEGIIAPNLLGLEIKNKDAEYGSDQTGAIVYATNASPDAGLSAAKTAKITTKGYYYFDGNIWQPFGNSGNWFYLPSFNLDISSQTTKTVDLYEDIYKKQFTQSVNNAFVVSLGTTLLTATNNSLYTATQLAYIVTYYDNTIIDNISITADGKMTYTVLSTDPTPDSFINIVCLVK